MAAGLSQSRTGSRTSHTRHTRHTCMCMSTPQPRAHGTWLDHTSRPDDAYRMHVWLRHGWLPGCWGCSSGTCWAMAPEKPRTANCTAKPAADSGLLALQWKGLPAVRLAIGAPPFCALQLDWDVRLLPARFAAVTLGWVRITRPATRRAEVAAAAPAAPAAIETGIDSSDEIQCKRPPGRSARYGQRHGDLYCARSRFGICPWAR
jgi:hypothetical protein